MAQSLGNILLAHSLFKIYLYYLTNVMVSRTLIEYICPEKSMYKILTGLEIASSTLNQLKAVYSNKNATSLKDNTKNTTAPNLKI